MSFAPAARRNSKLRLAITAPAGGGKTWTMLQILKGLGCKSIGVIDSERGSASKYARKANTAEGAGNWDFLVSNLTDKSPHDYIATIAEAAREGIDGLGVDSYSHSWMGALELVDRGGGWVKAGKSVSPLVQRLVDAILSYPGHVVATMRSKADHVIEKDEKTGRAVVRKVGMAAVAREGTEFEFDVILDMALDGTITVAKSRAGAALPVGAIYTRDEVPTKIVPALRGWLDEGAPLSAVESFGERIKFCQTLEDLGALVPALQALPREDRAALKTIYESRKAEIASAAEAIP